MAREASETGAEVGRTTALAPPGPSNGSITPDRPGPPWQVVLLLTFLLGAMLGGVAVYILGWRLPTEPLPSYSEAETQVTSASPGAERNLDSEDSEERAERPPKDEPGASGAAAPIRIDLTPRQKLGNPSSVKPDAAPDNSPSGLRDRFGSAVLRLTAFDEDGDRRPAAPAVAVGVSRVVAPFSAVEGTTRAEIQGPGRRPLNVLGVVAHDTQFDLVLLQVEAEFAEPHLLPRSRPLGQREELVLLGPVADSAWREAAALVSPGEVDPYTNAPRLRIEPAANTWGALIDSLGELVGLVPESNGRAIPVYPAAAWIARAGTAVSLEAFLRTAGPGSPTSRVRRARKLLSQRRYEEAARLLLRITAEDARLVPEVTDDLRLAALEAARKNVTLGNGPGALALLTEALQRLPEDAELWASRGRAHGLTGEVRPAISAFLHAIQIDPTHEEAWSMEARGILLDEVNALTAAGQPAAALQLLTRERVSFPGDGQLRMTGGQLLLSSRRFQEAAELFTEAARLDATVSSEARRLAQKATDLAGGPGAVVIDFPPGSREIVVSAVLDGSTVLNLLVDPTEELTVVPAWAARAAGYELGSARRVRFFSDPWAEEVPSIQIGIIAVSGVSAARIQAVVTDSYAAPAADGVLGATYLSLFRTVQDQHLGRMVLYPR